MVLLVTSRPRTVSALGGGSAAGPSHSRHFVAARQFGRFRIEADIKPGFYEYTSDCAQDLAACAQSIQQQPQQDRGPDRPLCAAQDGGPASSVNQ